MKIAIVDDEQSEIYRLQKLFEKLQKEMQEDIEIFPFSSGRRLLKEYDYSYDMICLDIDMPEFDGIQTAKKIRKLDRLVLIVFVTNMAQMAIQGYEVQAFDFLLKPVDYYSFKMKMRNAVSVIRERKVANIVISIPGGMKKISTDDIFYIEVQGHNLSYHTKNGVFQQKGALKELESKLQGLPFKRCNQCYLVNLKYVDCVNRDDLQVGGDWLKISRPRKKEFLNTLANYLGGVSI